MSAHETVFTYVCRELTGNAGDGQIWEHIPSVSLRETATGGAARQSTIVKCCRDAEYVRILFECEDDFINATMNNRDDPLYKEDVVEIFIDEAGTGRRYMELEISPNNVLFDAMVDNDLNGRIQADTRWDAEGLLTSVKRSAGLTVYEIALPFGLFEALPEKGTEWRINFYRIDMAPDGARHYDAWSPTGAINFHIPAAFGVMRFE